MSKRKVFKGNAEERGKKAKMVLMKYFDGCDRCGYKGQPPQMDLDHLNPKEKSFPLSSGSLAHRSIDEIMEEVDKCQMLCSNCHRLVSTKYEHHIKDDITYHPINDKVLYTMSASERDREFLRGDS
jgi:5-methylcytosine-specific restriction endonuclease McrA